MYWISPVVFLCELCCFPFLCLSVCNGKLCIYIHIKLYLHSCRLVTSMDETPLTLSPSWLKSPLPHGHRHWSVTSTDPQRFIPSNLKTPISSTSIETCSSRLPCTNLQPQVPLLVCLCGGLFDFWFILWCVCLWVCLIFGWFCGVSMLWWWWLAVLGCGGGFVLGCGGGFVCGWWWWVCVWLVVEIMGWGERESREERECEGRKIILKKNIESYRQWLL